MADATPLGALLIDEGLLTDAQLDAALAEQARSGKPLGRLLIESGHDLRGRARAHAGPPGRARVRRPQRPRRSTARSPSLVTESLARRYQAIPIGWEDGRLVVAMADPSNVFAVDDIRAIAGAEVRTVVATAPPDQRDDRALLPHRHRRRRGRAGRDRRRRRRDRPRRTSRSSSRTRRSSSSSTCSSTQAVGDRASDIHVEPTETRPAHPVPHRRRAARGDALAAQHPGRRDQPPQGHGRHQHRRAPHPAGRPHQHEGRRPRHRPARRDAADRVRREGRHANPRQGPGGPAPRGARLPARDARRGSRRRTASRTARSS